MCSSKSANSLYQEVRAPYSVVIIPKNVVIINFFALIGNVKFMGLATNKAINYIDIDGTQY